MIRLVPRRTGMERSIAVFTKRVFLCAALTAAPACGGGGFEVVRDVTGDEGSLESDDDGGITCTPCTGEGDGCGTGLVCALLEFDETASMPAEDALLCVSASSPTGCCRRIEDQWGSYEEECVYHYP